VNTSNTGLGDRPSDEALAASPEAVLVPIGCPAPLAQELAGYQRPGLRDHLQPPLLS
jgi:hypothetical protein